MTDLVVDGNVVNSSPYLINSANVTTTFTNITLLNGGYIRITVPCVLTSTNFYKTIGGTAAPAYDIEIVGTPGQQGVAGVQGADYVPAQAENGDNAKCDSAGGGCAHYGRDGKDGHTGNPGQNAVADQAITNGSPAPTVTLNLGNLTANISVLNQGGSGGIGGTGGKGGTGQKGGNGGSSKTCGAVHCPGGDGGKGGNGGNGGKGGNGGNGGNGAMVTINYTGTGTVIPYSIPSAGGNAGSGGAGGAGGAGGSGGGDNPSGATGYEGQRGDSSGYSGNPGSFNINGTIADENALLV